MKANAQRYIREYMARRRGGRSYKSEAETLRILLAVAEGELTQASAAKALKTDIVSVRERIQTEVKAGVAVALAMLPPRAAPTGPIEETP